MDYNVIPEDEIVYTKLDLGTPSEWKCELFGTGNALVLRPMVGKVPNWFWRWMQYVCFGNKWIKDSHD